MVFYLDVLVSPRCGLPGYLLETEDHARECGRIRGYILTSILCIAIFFMQWLGPIGYAVMLFFLFNTIPPLIGFYERQRWHMYHLQRQGYLRHNLTNEQAVSHIQHLYVNETVLPSSIYKKLVTLI